MRTMAQIKYDYPSGARLVPLFHDRIREDIDRIGRRTSSELLYRVVIGTFHYAIPADGVEERDIEDALPAYHTRGNLERYRITGPGAQMSSFGRVAVKDLAHATEHRVRPAPDPNWRERFATPRCTDGDPDDDEDATQRLIYKVLSPPVFDVSAVSDLDISTFEWFVRVVSKKVNNRLVPHVRLVRNEDDGRVHKTTDIALTRFLTNWCDFDAVARATLGPPPEDREALKEWRARGEAAREEALAHIREPYSTEGGLVISNNEEEIVKAYVDGPSSCMAGDHNFSAAKHPVRVYAHEDGDVAIAYWRRGSRITARALINTRTNQFSRVYGDEIVLERELHKAGYRGPTDDALMGCRIRKIWKNRRTQLVGPYIDASGTGPRGAWVEDAGDYLVIGPGFHEDGEPEGDYVADATNGVLREYEDRRERCGHCEELVEPEHLYSVDGDAICEVCRDENYTRCEVSGEYVPNHEIVQVYMHNECTNTYFDAEVDEQFLIENDGEYRSGHGLHSRPVNRFVTITAGDTEGDILQRSRAVRDENGRIWERDDLLTEGGEITDENDGFAVGLSPEGVDAGDRGPTPRCPDTPDMITQAAVADMIVDVASSSS